MARCKTPYIPYGAKTGFPCRSCLDCRKARASSWGFRLRQEAKVADTAWFLTLTYDNEHVAFTPTGLLTLLPKHVTNVIKVLRQTQLRKHKKMASSLKLKNDCKPIKYFLVGEYGGRFNRPHYHIIIYNVDLDVLIGKPQSRLALNDPETYLKGKFNFNCKYYKYGYISVGQVTPDSCNYTLKYISKGITIPQFPKDNRHPEFAHMSKGLGASYLIPSNINWHWADLYNRYYINQDGYKIPIPDYYKKRMYDDSMRQDIAEYLQEKQQTEFDQLTPRQQARKLQLDDKLITANHKKRMRLVHDKTGKI